MKTLTYPNDQACGSHEVVSLHGLPGVRSRQNRLIAERIAALTQKPTHVLFYRGLGEAPGVFSCAGSVLDVRLFFEERFASGVTTVDLIGHSFGGFLSLLVGHLYPNRVRRIVLLSPLVQFFEPDLSARFFQDLKSNYPHFGWDEGVNLAQEFHRLGEQYPPIRLIQSLSRNLEVLYLQAKDDDITPVFAAEEARRFFSCQLDFRLVDQDHAFLSNREELASTIAAFLAK